MNIFISFLLSTSCNFDTIYLSTILKDNKVSLWKNNKLIISILTTFATFVSIIIGFYFNIFVIQNYSTVFSGMCFSFIGLYYFINHIKISEEKNNFDTSYYVQYIDKSKSINKVVENINNENQSTSLSNILKLTYYLLFDNIIIGFLVGISLINISLVTFFNFLLTILILSFFKYINNPLFYKYSNLINGLILFALGIYVIFI